MLVAIHKKAMRVSALFVLSLCVLLIVAATSAAADMVPGQSDEVTCAQLQHFYDMINRDLTPYNAMLKAQVEAGPVGVACAAAKK